MDKEVDKTDEAEGTDDDNVDRGKPKGEVDDEGIEGRQVDEKEMDDDERIGEGEGICNEEGTDDKEETNGGRRVGDTDEEE